MFMTWVVFNLCVQALDDTDLVGDVNGLVIRAKTDESLLLTVRADKGVDLDSLDVVHLLDGILDLVLVGVDVDDEDKGVVALNLGHGSLSGEGITQNGVLIQTGTAGDRSTGVSGLASKREGRRTTETSGGEHTAGASREVTLQSSLLGVLGTGHLRGNRCLLGGIDLLASRRSLSLFGHLFLFLSVTSHYTHHQGQTPSFELIFLSSSHSASLIFVFSSKLACSLSYSIFPQLLPLIPIMTSPQLKVLLSLFLTLISHYSSSIAFFHLLFTSNNRFGSQYTRINPSCTYECGERTDQPSTGWVSQLGRAADGSRKKNSDKNFFPCDPTGKATPICQYHHELPHFKSCPNYP